MRSIGIRGLCILALTFAVTSLALGQSTAQLEAWTTADGTTTDQRGNQVHWVGNQLFVTNRPEPDYSSSYYGTPQDQQILVYDVPPGTTTLPSPSLLPMTNPTSNGFFGSSMAATSEFFFAGIRRGFFAGEARVYQNQAGTWNEFQTLVPPNGQQSDAFGSSLATAGADHLVVGAARADRIAEDSGTAYIYEYNGSTWMFDQEVLPSDGEFQGRFGESAATDGSTIFVGAPRADSPGVNADNGAVYIFEDGPGGWTEVQKLQPPDLASQQGFGSRVILDGGRLFAGAPNVGGGAIYVFEKAGSSWQQVSKIIPAGFPLNVSLGTAFGASFDVQGSKLACGIFNYNLDSNLQAGQIFLFEEDAGTWTVDRQLRMSTPAPYALLGNSIDFGADGRIAAGAPGRFPDSFSEAMVFDSNLEQVMFCFGQGFAGTACANCPCSNNASRSDLGGCVNSAGSSAQLRVSGIASAAGDTLGLSLTEALPSTFALLLSSPVALPSMGPCLAGGAPDSTLDGLRCLGVSLMRHGIRSTDMSGASNLPWGDGGSSTNGLITGSGWIAGQTRNFQAFYREDETQGCLTGVGTTNAVRVEIRP